MTFMIRLNFQSLVSKYASVPRSSVRHIPKGLGSDGNGDGGAGVDDLLSTDETFGTLLLNDTQGISHVIPVERNPSLRTMAIHLQVFSPKCIATSKTNLPPSGATCLPSN